MATTYWKDEQQITGDFLMPIDGVTVLVPFENLRVWDDDTLAGLGISKVVTVDVPGVISDRQFYHRLKQIGLITEQEALDAVSVGAIPAALMTFVNALPTEQQFDAKMLLSGAVEFRRNHPLTAAVGAAQGWTDGQIDQFFIDAAAL